MTQLRARRRTEGRIPSAEVGRAAVMAV